MERLLILSTLIVATSSLYGLLALWAATSRRRWFVRTAVVSMALALPLLIPAYELTVTYALQALTVVLGVQVYRRFIAWRTRRHDLCDDTLTDLPPARLRFSLANLLWLTVFIALAAAVVVRLPTHEWQGWALVMGVAIFAGIQALAVVWIVYGRWPWWLKLPIASFVAIGSYFPIVHGVYTTVPGTPAMKSDWTISLLAPFGYDVIPFLTRQLFFNYSTTWNWVIYVVLAPIALMASWLVFRRLAKRNGRSTEGVPGKPTHRLQYRLASTAIGLLTLAVLLPPGAAFLWMLNPPLIPEVARPEPNGYLDLVEAGQKLDTHAFGFWDMSSTLQQLQTEVARHQQDFDRINVGLSRECTKPLRYDDWSRSLDLDEIQSLRAAARALCGRGRLAKSEGRYEDAFDDYLTIVRLGAATGRGGLMVHSLVGVAIRGIGFSQLTRIRDHLSPDQCRQTIDVLHTVDTSHEPIEDFIRRERIWTQHAQGWLTVFLDTLSGGDGWRNTASSTLTSVARCSYDS